MKTFTKDSFINLIMKSHSDFVVAKGNISHTFTVRLKTTESQSGIGNDNSNVFTQVWALNDTVTSDGVDYFIFTMWGYPPSPLNDFTDTLRFEGRQFQVPADAILYIIENMRKQGLENYQSEILRKIEIIGDYLISQKRTFGTEILDITKNKEGKTAILMLEFDKNPQLPSDLFFDDFQNYQKGSRIVLVKLFSGRLTASTQKIKIENDPKIHPVPERTEKNYSIELYFENGDLTAKYFDNIKYRSFTFHPSNFSIM